MKFRSDLLLSGVVLFVVGSSMFLFRPAQCGLDLACYAQNFFFGLANFAFVFAGLFLSGLGLASPFFKKGATLGGFFRFLAKDGLVSSVFGVLLVPGTPEDAATGGISIGVGAAYFAFKALQYFLI